MRVTPRLELRDFRNLRARRRCGSGRGSTVVAGPQRRRQDEPARGALLRPAPAARAGPRNERELVALRRAAGAAGARRCEDATASAPHRGRLRSRARRSACASTARPSSGLPTSAARPLGRVFLPDRLELVQGCRRRCAARTSTRSSPRCGRPARRRAARYSARAGAAQRAARPDPRRARAGRARCRRWDAELARHGDRADARPRRGGRRACAARSPSTPPSSGCEGEAELRYRPRSEAGDAEGLAAELAERRDADLERGFTGHGPHRDELGSARGGRALRALRLAGPAAARRCWRCCFAEREALAAERGARRR